MLRASSRLFLALACVGCADITTEPDPSAPGAFTPGPDKIAFGSNRDGSDYLYVANLDGTGLVRLVPGHSPDWSWDGRRIAFARIPYGGSGTETAVWVLDADGTTLLKDGFIPVVVGPVLTQLVKDRPEVRIPLVASQVVGLIVTRYLIALPPMALMPADEVVARIGPVIQHYLTGDLP